MFHRRRRRILIVAFLAIAFAWGGFAFWSYHSSQSFLNQAIAETDVLDPHWRLADLLADRKQISDDQNSALIIMAGHRFLGNIDQEKRNRAEEIADQDLDCQNRCFNEKQREALIQLVKMHFAALGEFRKIATMPSGRFPLAVTPMTRGSQFGGSFARTALETLRFELRERLAQGDFETADQRVLAMINVAPSLGDEPYTSTIIVRCAVRRIAIMAVCEWLAKSEPNPRILRQMQLSMELESQMPLAAMAAKCERATGFELFDTLAAMTPPLPNPWEALQESIEIRVANVSSIPRQKAHILKTMNQVVEITNSPMVHQLRQLGNCRKNIPVDAITIRYTLPLFETLLPAIHRSQADLHCTITALAAERFRIQNQRWPNNCDELVTAGLLNSIPNDPFDGNPLRFKTTENGLLIYSIGQDRLDNDGAFNPDKPTEPGSDIIFRMYDPAHRRLPPLQPKPNAEEPKDQ